MEPRFSIPDTTPRSSKTTITIGGIEVYIYGLGELQHKSAEHINVLYLAHQRTRTYLVTQDMAHEILHRYRRHNKAKRMETIAVTINMRNHGDREIDPTANQTWDNGNENHAMDLLSLITGSAQDFKLIASFLPAYLPQFTTHHNVMMGISLGGHTSWHLAALAPGQFEAFIIVVGSPNLAPLLLDRLGVDATALGVSKEEAHTVSYDRLLEVMDETQKRRWPKALAEFVQKQDRWADRHFPDVPLLLCAGEDDTLVPPRYTCAWWDRQVARRGGQADSQSMFIQKNTGHSCTKEMVAMIADWLVHLNAKRGRDSANM